MDWWMDQHTGYVKVKIKDGICEYKLFFCLFFGPFVDYSIGKTESAQIIKDFQYLINSMIKKNRRKKFVFILHLEKMVSCIMRMYEVTQISSINVIRIHQLIRTASKFISSSISFFSIHLNQLIQ